MNLVLQNRRNAFSGIAGIGSILQWFLFLFVCVKACADPVLLTPGIDATNRAFLVAMRFDFNKGPKGEVHQVMLSRDTQLGFQLMRKWLTVEQFSSSNLIQAAQSPSFYHEIISSSNNHMFRAIIPTEDYLEHELALKAETNSAKRPNILLRDYALERRLCATLRDTGIASITNISADLGSNKYLVSTYTATNVTMEMRYEAEKNRRVFEIQRPNGDFERAEYTLFPNSDVGKPFASLKSSKRPSSGGTPTVYLEAEFYHLDRSFPSMDDIHANVRQLATSNHNFNNWHVLTNEKIYTVTKKGDLRPPTKPLPGFKWHYY